MIGRIIRDYKIVGALGSGGMADVYLAQRVDGMLKRNVVIKIVGAHLAEKERSRFIGEMQAQERLSHPNIAQIFDAGQLEDGRPFMIIEYVEGQSLREMLVDHTSGDRRPVALPLEIVVEIAEQACAGLSEAHRKKIVHRDIKPENILVSREGDKYKVKIIDFGIALSQENGILPARIPTAGVIGTPEYISPEQVMPAKYYLNKPGEKPGYSADIYALGVVIYEMLTGRRPFSGNGHEVALKHTWEIPVAPSKVRPELNIPPAVDQVVLKSLAKQPSERQKSIELLAQELRESIKTSLKLELPTQAEVIEHENNQGPEIVKPIASSITSKPLTKTFFLALAGVFLMGLLAILLYFKPLGSLSGQRNATASGSPSPSAVPILNMTVFLTRLDKRGKENPVSPSTTFYSGEGVKINIQAGQKGFLYILSRGSSGKVSMLYPDAQIQGGDNQIVKGEVIGIPTDGGWFKFSNEPGTERLYLVFAENKTERLIMEFENARSQDKIALPEDLKRQAVDFGGANGCLKGEGPLLVGVLNLSHLP